MDMFEDAVLAKVGDIVDPVALANRGELRLKAGDRGGFSDLSKAVEADPYG